MRSPDEIRPWDYPPIVQEPVRLEELIKLFDRKRASSMVAALKLVPRESADADILSFSYGSGYYRRDAEPVGDGRILHPGLMYLALEVVNVRLLIQLDGPVDSVLVSARANVDTPWGSWFQYHSRPIPIDRLQLATELATYA